MCLPQSLQQSVQMDVAWTLHNARTCSFFATFSRSNQTDIGTESRTVVRLRRTLQSMPGCLPLLRLPTTPYSLGAEQTVLLPVSLVGSRFQGFEPTTIPIHRLQHLECEYFKCTVLCKKKLALNTAELYRDMVWFSGRAHVGQALLTRLHFLDRSSPCTSCRRMLSAFPIGTEALIMANLAPEPEASAAGVRTSYIIRQLVQSSKIPVHFAAPQAPAPTDVALPSCYHRLPVNDTERANQVIGPILRRCQHLLVIFDRFYAEEMHSHRFHSTFDGGATAPTTFVLDMQDFHALRYARKKRGPAALPAADDPRLQRELASIYRCDLTLVCSPYEIQLLTETYGVPKNKLCLAPLFGDWESPKGEPASGDANRSFQERQDFVFIGGFRHAPNVDAVRRLHDHLWPLIRQHPQLNHTNLHVYGAYCPPQLQQELHQPHQGFLVHGFAPCVQSLLRDKRVMLSPLSFGAGIKGKHVDAWKVGLPVVTTPIGSEGMLGDDDDDGSFGGVVATNDAAFVRAAHKLYTDQQAWEDSTVPMPRLLQALCNGWSDVESKLANVMLTLPERRKQDYMRSILWQQSLRSTEYFSKFIELKEQKRSINRDRPHC